jgi:hypothetical protein
MPSVVGSWDPGGRDSRTQNLMRKDRTMATKKTTAKQAQKTNAKATKPVTKKTPAKKATPAAQPQETGVYSIRFPRASFQNMGSVASGGSDMAVGARRQMAGACDHAAGQLPYPGLQLLPNGTRRPTVTGPTASRRTSPACDSPWRKSTRRRRIGNARGQSKGHNLQGTVPRSCRRRARTDLTECSMFPGLAPGRQPSCQRNE